MSKYKDYLEKAWLDRVIAPEDDFYQYANGSWLQDNPVPNEQSIWGAFSEIQERNEKLLRGLLTKPLSDGANAAERVAKRFYQCGLDRERSEAAGITPLEPVVELITNLSSLNDLPKVIASIQSVGPNPFFSIGIMPDFDDASRYLLYFSQGGLGLPEQSYYTRSDEAGVLIQTKYREHVAKQFVNFGYSAKKAKEASDQIYALETDLAQASYPAEKLRDVKVTMNKFKLADLDSRLPHFSVRAFVGELGAAGQSVVSVNNIGFFEVFDDLITNTPMGTIKHYVIWHVIRQFAQTLPRKFEKASFDFYAKTLSGQAKQKPRWKQVLDVATNDIGEAVAQVYVDAAFSNESKRRCETMVQNLLKATKGSLETLEWMTDETKEAALAKLSKFNYKVGFPEQWKDYEKLEIPEDATYTTARMLATHFETVRQIERLDLPVDRSEWAMPAHIVNAYYHPLMNEIVFPAGILQPPMFYADADDPVIYGGIGTVIGHEITHGFDDQGSRFDGAGQLKDWWSEVDRAEFERRAQQLVEQFNSYTVLGDKHVNGALTLGENIADLGGLKIALEALRLSKPTGKLTKQEQRRFFLSFATIWRTNCKDEIAALLLTVDPHSPARFRANGPLSNLAAFAETFDVPKGAPMRRDDDKTVRIW